jgi:hypothetical protein
MEEHKRGQWVMRAFDRKYSDFCTSMNTPTEPFYMKFKDQKKCPMMPGVRNKKSLNGTD